MNLSLCTIISPIECTLLFKYSITFNSVRIFVINCASCYWLTILLWLVIFSIYLTINPEVSNDLVSVAVHRALLILCTSVHSSDSKRNQFSETKAFIHLTKEVFWWFIAWVGQQIIISPAPLNLSVLSGLHCIPLSIVPVTSVASWRFAGRWRGPGPCPPVSGLAAGAAAGEAAAALGSECLCRGSALPCRQVPGSAWLRAR